jgi:cytochrome d ubiquinol oxidase subunit II
MPHMVDRIKVYPFLFVLPILTLLFIANVPREIHKKNDGWAFLSSCAAIVFLLLILGVGIFPVIVRSTINPSIYSLTVFNSASSPLTLKVLLIIVAIGIPMVIGYGFYIYHIFRGKVKIGPHSY